MDPQSVKEGDGARRGITEEFEGPRRGAASAGVRRRFNRSAGGEDFCNRRPRRGLFGGGAGRGRARALVTPRVRHADAPARLAGRFGARRFDADAGEGLAAADSSASLCRRVAARRVLEWEKTELAGRHRRERAEAGLIVE